MRSLPERRGGRRRFQHERGQRDAERQAEREDGRQRLRAARSAPRPRRAGRRQSDRADRVARAVRLRSAARCARFIQSVNTRCPRSTPPMVGARAEREENRDRHRRLHPFLDLPRQHRGRDVEHGDRRTDACATTMRRARAAPARSSPIAASAPTISGGRADTARPAPCAGSGEITSARPLEMSGQRAAIGRASLSSTRATVASVVDPTNGCTPHAYSYSSTPNANTSARASTGWPLICSGAMYAGVPISTPGCVANVAGDRPIRRYRCARGRSRESSAGRRRCA